MSMKETKFLAARPNGLLFPIPNNIARIATIPPFSISFLPFVLQAVLWNSNYFLRFRFRFWFLLLKSYGSVSDFWQVTVPVPVLVPYLDHKKHSFKKKNLEKILSFYILSFFYKEKNDKFHQIYFKMGMKNMLNEGNQIHNFPVPVPTLWQVTVPFPSPVPQGKKLWFRFHNTDCRYRLWSQSNIRVMVGSLLSIILFLRALNKEVSYSTYNLLESLCKSQ